MQFKKITMTSEKRLDLESNQNETTWCVKENTLQFPSSKGIFSFFDKERRNTSFTIQRDKETNSNSPFKVFLFLESFLNLCFYLLLVPFRIRQKYMGQYEITTNTFQQILSSFLLIIVTLYSLLDLRYYQKEHNLRERPDQTFKYATIFIVHWIPVCWMLIFWIRKAQFVNLINVCQSRFIQSSDSTQTKFRWWPRVLKISISLIITKTLLFFYNDIWKDESGSFSTFMESAKQRFLYDFGLLDSPLTQGTYPVALTFVGYFAGAIQFMNEFTIYMFDQLCFTIAAMAFATCQHFLDEFRILINTNRETETTETSSRNKHETNSLTRNISNIYLDLIAVMDAINLTFGPCMVMFFMYLYPLIIWSLFDSLQNNSLVENLIGMHDVGILCLVTGTAAEASSKIEVFRQWLFEAAISSDSDDSTGLLRLATMHREVSSEAVGLKGYKFFSVNYRFVATMIGVVITYALVMFQFVTDPRKTSSAAGLLFGNISNT